MQVKVKEVGSTAKVKVKRQRPSRREYYRERRNRLRYEDDTILVNQILDMVEATGDRRLAVARILKDYRILKRKKEA